MQDWCVDIFRAAFYILLFVIIVTPWQLPMKGQNM
jgi:hypothetical protein